MTSGGQCVMTPGTALMLLWSASSWDMHTLEVSVLTYILFLQKEVSQLHLFPKTSIMPPIHMHNCWLGTFVTDDNGHEF